MTVLLPNRLNLLNVGKVFGIIGDFRQIMVLKKKMDFGDM